MHFIKVEGEVPIKGGGFDSFQGCLPPIQGGDSPVFLPDHQLPSLIHEGLILGQKSRRKQLLYSLFDT